MFELFFFCSKKKNVRTFEHPVKVNLDLDWSHTVRALVNQYSYLKPRCEVAMRVESAKKEATTDREQCYSGKRVHKHIIYKYHVSKLLPISVGKLYHKENFTKLRTTLGSSPEK
jgi:hypothetical protein